MIDAIRKEIRKALNDITDDCINGGASDFAQYRYECGRAMGLVMAEEIIKDLEQRARRSDLGDDDDLTE